MAWTLDGLGQVALAECNAAEAQARFTQALTLRHGGDQPGIADCLGGIGGVLALRTQHQDAVRLAAAAEALRGTLELPLGPMRRDLRDRWLSPLRELLGEDATATLWARGQSLQVDEAILLALALAVPSPAGSVDPPMRPLGAIDTRY